MPDEPVKVTNLRANLSEVLGRVEFGKERIAVKRHGRIAAVLVPVEDVERLERMERGEER